ncbi:hypothetical protein T492DRAFT_984780 [Pavlovales sp. CCMP2436]|nr:hypothetical protein T492DRAFT_984780 [Pavlovales sp. CCMP2436]
MPSTSSFDRALDSAFVRPEARATSSALASPLPESALRTQDRAKPIALTLPSMTRVSAGVEERLAHWLVKKGDWGPLAARRLRSVSNQAEMLSLPVTRTQLVLIRRALLHRRFGPAQLESAQSSSAELLRRFDGGERALKLAKEFDLPPLAVMRAIFAARGLSREQTKRALAAPADELGARDCAHVVEARANDLLFGNAKEAELELAPGVDGEVRVRRALCVFLNAHGVRYSLRAQSSPGALSGGSQHGGAAAHVRTSSDAGMAASRFGGAPSLGVLVGDVPIEHLEPELVLERAVLVEGRVVRWCEVRPIYAGENEALFVQLQVEKYTARFGEGLLIFCGGVSASFALQGCVSIGASAPLLVTAAHEQNAKKRAVPVKGQEDEAGLSPWLAQKLATPRRKLIFYRWAKRMTSAAVRARQHSKKWSAITAALSAQGHPDMKD